MDKIHVLGLKQTCHACPSQWEARDRQGRELYFRYRWGCLSVRHASVEHPDDALHETAAEIIRDYIGDHMDGFMTEEDLKKHTADRLIFID